MKFEKKKKDKIKIKKKFQAPPGGNFIFWKREFENVNREESAKNEGNLNFLFNGCFD